MSLSNTTIALLNQIVEPPVGKSNVKKYYLAAKVNTPFRGLLEQSNRTLTVLVTDSRVQSLKECLRATRAATVALASGLEAHFPHAVALIREYATRWRKDWVACTLRRYSNILERVAVCPLSDEPRRRLRLAMPALMHAARC